jgi:hypothetical protein
MDDQGTNREGGGSMMRRSPKQFRAGLRLMLLIVALFCVLCAYYRAHRDLQRENLRAELAQLRHRFDVLKAELPTDPGSHDPEPVLHLRDVSDKIAKMQQQLDEEKLNSIH